ncbi:MAG: radical SAM family heme chaperone HemW [Traorella sp.]
MVKSMYIHVPFCDSICAYCDFERCKRIETLSKSWIDIVTKDIEQRKNEKIDTLYIGGGTPTCLSYQELDQLLSACDCFHPVEYTIEANIENLSHEKIELLVQHGINRISLGVQSLQDDLIRLIQRHHQSNDIFHKIDEIYEAGIHNISCDMIYGLPNQTLDMWLHDLTTLASKKEVTHISIYSLTIEKNSSFGRNHISKVDDELDEEMYFKAIDLLESFSFHQYEISNFSKEGYESKHNTCYWEYLDFIGIGCGAYGKENHVYYHYPFKIHEYLNQTLEKDVEELSIEDEIFEMIMMGLRMKKGIQLSNFEHLFQIDLLTKYKTSVEKHLNFHNLEIIDGYLRCTQQGFGILNTILIDFMD